MENSSYIQKVEAGVIRSMLKKVLLPILLSFGCGTEDKKKTPQKTEDQDTSRPISVTPGGTGIDRKQQPDGDINYTPGPARRLPLPGKPEQPELKRETRRLEDELRKYGFACQFIVMSETKMRWAFGLLPEEEIGNITNTIPYKLALDFEREDKNSPWDFQNPTITGKSTYPKLVQLVNDVVAELDLGVEYIKNKYDCFIQDSPHKI